LTLVSLIFLIYENEKDGLGWKNNNLGNLYSSKCASQNNPNG
jgi:hypothetical protein